MMDVPIRYGVGEFVSDMGHHLGQERLADMRDAPALPGKEEYVPNTEQSRRKRLAVMKDAPINQRREVYVLGMEQRENNCNYEGCTNNVQKRRSLLKTSGKDNSSQS